MFASIDIGTNSVLLLVGKPTSDGGFELVDDRLQITRLGHNLYQGNTLCQESIDRTIDVLKEYQAICKSHGVHRIAIVATEALRQASNANAFIMRAKVEFNLAVRIISSEEEARFTYEASAKDFGKNIIVVDIGGGSTEIIRPCSQEITARLELHSLPLGCVLGTENYLPSDPTTNDEVMDLRHYIQEKILFATIDPLKNDEFLVATAGTATTLMAMHFELSTYGSKFVHGQHLMHNELKELIELLQKKTIAERKQLPGLHPQRADVILSGAIILDELMTHLRASTVTISDRGVRWGVFYDEFCG